eukprot:5502079-Pyramimonas_sp.AAC.1
MAGAVRAPRIGGANLRPSARGAAPTAGSRTDLGALALPASSTTPGGTSGEWFQNHPLIAQTQTASLRGMPLLLQVHLYKCTRAPDCPLWRDPEGLLSV